MDILAHNSTPKLLASHALSKAITARPIIGLMKHLETKLRNEAGPEKIAEIMSQLLNVADTLHAQNVKIQIQ